MVLLELAVFTVVLFVLSWVRQRQINSLKQQETYLRRFAEGVGAWRSGNGIPPDARLAIELLVDMPLDRRIVRKLARGMLRDQRAPSLADNPFWIARSQLEGEKREAFDWLLRNFFFAMTYSDWFSGPFIRRFRVGGLSQETQTEIAIETVFSRGMHYAPA